jgi:hypothetical protein
MATQKKEYSASDAQPVVLYAKPDADGRMAEPITLSSFGGLLISQGMAIPLHDQRVIDEADPNNVTITYKKNGSTVGVRTIAIAGTTTTDTVV